MGSITETFIQQVLLSSYYEPVIFLGTRHTAGSKTKFLPWWGLQSSGEDGETNDKQTNTIENFLLQRKITWIHNKKWGVMKRGGTITCRDGKASSRRKLLNTRSEWRWGSKMLEDLTEEYFQKRQQQAQMF